ncbi:MAG: hypothetical protein JWL77_167 [Chthonomonadaceae bacterium]|nr:hypothetical protein [Chthonomonadaceae bacterium]
MRRTVFLDTGPLGILTNPKRPPETVAALNWAVDMMVAGHRIIVPAIADYEVRRELERAGKKNGIAALDAWNSAYPDRYLPSIRFCLTAWREVMGTGTQRRHCYRRSQRT